MNTEYIVGKKVGFAMGERDGALLAPPILKPYKSESEEYSEGYKNGYALSYVRTISSQLKGSNDIGKSKLIAENIIKVCDSFEENNEKILKKTI